MAPPLHTVPDWHSNPPESPLLREWLLSEGSLTCLLRQLSDDLFDVQPVQQGWQQLREDECRALGEPSGTLGWVREVFLCGQHQPWVYARSVASRNALDSNGFDLASLGSRSLGELLFSDQAFVRGAFELCSLPANAWPAALRTDNSGPAPLWARRSCFTRKDLKILVAEAFLPAFWQRLAQPAPAGVAN
ncbi:chorismate lyase [Thiopseudomonas denitrificans]|uniref:Probable chorismate pyruvate-lyase n=1 Tax=Thiopseudomonas denitrificans TaxID=1501432 RepID=A0A4V3D4S4_9GAMM|nr:chorismate lyase [Thiopseudomonas denitrificans]TDQ37087.1 chorismate lyase [Thiopseudomonas denitrificans]